MGVRRMSFVLVCLPALVSALSAPPLAPRSSNGCSHFLVREDAATNGFDCPKLPTLAQAGFVRAASPEHAKRGRVREIIDGDTIRVSFGDMLDTVRIVNINT